MGSAVTECVTDPAPPLTPTDIMSIIDSELVNAIRASVQEAHAADQKYMATHFHLGTPGQHVRRLVGYLSPEAKAALRAGGLKVVMGNEYSEPVLVEAGLDTLTRDVF